jgi:anti-anti-sigma regulatory factor
VLAARRLTIDLIAVTGCGSAGLRALLELHTAAGEAGA